MNSTLGSVMPLAMFKLTDPPANLFWTYLIVEVLRLNWLTKMWRNTKHEIRKLFLPAFLLWKILILKEGLRLQGLIHSCGTSVKPERHWLSILYLSLIEGLDYFVVVWNSSHSQWDRRRRPLHNQPRLSWEDQPEKKNFMEFLLNLLKSWWRANLAVEKNVAAIEIFCHIKIIFDAKELFFCVKIVRILREQLCLE